MCLGHVFSYAAFSSVHGESSAYRRSGYTNVGGIGEKFTTFFWASVLVYHICLFKEAGILREVIFHDEVRDSGILEIDDKQ